MRFPIQPLIPGQVHVWTWAIDPAVARVEQGALDYLDAGEQERYRRFHFDADRFRYALAHIGLRRILGAHLGCAPQQVSLRVDRFGKPAVAAGPFFNLSHSRRTAMLALSTETEVGVDIEDVRPIEWEVAQHFFSLREQAALASLQGEAWLQGFYRCWTRKEAILKAEGVGLQLPLSGFDVSLLPGVPAALLGVRPPLVFRSPWTLHDLESPAGTIAALAAGNPQAEVLCFHL